MPVSICIYLVFLIVSLKSLFLSTISVTSLILFRISRPTLNQINRINLYRKQVSLSYRIVLLTDICNNVSVGFTKYCVSRSDVINKYPEIKSMGGICRNKSDSFYMWILHSEHYLLWDNNYHLNYKYLW